MVAQAYRVKARGDGKLAMYCRGRAPVPFTPDVPVPVLTSRLTRLRGQCNGVLMPGQPDRDTDLKPWYGNLRDPASPYYRTGPTKDQVGINVPYATLTEYNSPNTNDFQITTPMTFTNQIVYGRLKLSGNGQITARNCVFPGPKDPTNSAFTGETAIVDGNNAGASTLSTFVDCTFYQRYPHPRFNAHKGGRAKFERCHIFWVTDGFGPYTTPGLTHPTALEIVACRVERLVYWPGPLFADHRPYYWNGTAFQSSTTGAYTRSATGTTLDKAGYFDDQHNDGNHSDCVEIHNAFGSHTWNPTARTWSGDGIHIWGNAFIADDAYAAGNPSNLPLTIPLLGYGDNPKRGLSSNGQLPGMARPPGSWTKPINSAGMFAANGVALYVGQVTNVQFGTDTSVVIHGNYLQGGNMGFQEQKKSLATISFVFYDQNFGPDYYMWSSDNTRDVYPVRINDYTTANTMPNWSTGPVRIPNHPDTGAPPFGSGGSNQWVGASKWGYADGTPLGVGSSSVAGLRVI